MKNWLFVNANENRNGRRVSAEEKWARRSSDGFWGLPKQAHYKHQMKPGDQAIFYLGLPLKEFAGPVTLTSSHTEITPEEKTILSRGDANFAPDFGIYFNLENSPNCRCPVDSIFDDLKVHRGDKKKWQSLLRGGIIELPQEDFDLIVSFLKK